MELTFAEGDHSELAERLGALAGADTETWTAMAKELRARVEVDHSLDHWVNAVARVVRGTP
jgi:hypothetical protein